MRDPAYLIILGIAIIALLDQFAFGGTLLNYFGNLLTTITSWITDLIP